MKKRKPVEENLMGMSNALTPDIRKKRQQYRKKRKHKAYFFVTISALALLAAAVFIFGFMGTNVKTSLTIEAGDDMVKASDFFEGAVRAVFVSGNDIDTAKPGEYELTVRNGILFYKVTLNIRDTIPPTAKPKHVRIRLGNDNVQPSDFVKNVFDLTDVTISFKSPVNINIPGDNNVTVIIRDLGGNETYCDSKITVFPDEVNTSATIETGYTDFSVRDFLTEEAPEHETDRILTALDDDFYHRIGQTKIEILYNNAIYTVSVNVDDTTPPKAEAEAQWTYKDSPVDAESFIKNINDETQVTVKYAVEPDFSKPGKQTVELVLEDSAKNTATYKAVLTVKEDKDAPVITAQDRTVYLDDNIRFSEGVTAFDDCDGNVPVKVDIGDFDKNTPGVYPIKFIATDKAGNTAELTVKFTLKKKKYYLYTHEVMDTLFDSVYSRIITEGMTDEEKMRAIYDYVRENISYNGTSEKSDWEQEAYRGLRWKQGDAFTFYAVSRKLLTMAGIENKPVERINSDSSHYWNMVKVNGEWYHFDTCPHYKDYPIDSFMLTDEQAAEYSEKTGGYYTYK